MERLNDFEKKQMKDFIIEQGFEGRKSSGRWKKQLVVAAAVIMIGIPALGAAFPAWGQRIPIVGGVFEEHGAFVYENLGQIWPTIAELQEFSTEVNLSGELGSVVITIEESVFDGKRLSFSYTIEGNRNLGSYPQIDIENLGLLVDGEDQQDGAGWGFRPSVLQRVSRNEYIGVSTIYFSNLLGVIDNGVVHFDVIFNNRSWHAAFPIERVDLENIVINETFNNDGFEITIISVLNTPSGMVMHYRYELPVGYGLDFLVENGEIRTEQNAEMKFRIQDDLGNEWARIFGSVESEWIGTDLRTSVTSNYVGWLDFSDVTRRGEGSYYAEGNYHAAANYLIITPYIGVLDEGVMIREVILGEIRIDLP